ncbi:MAG: PadR family transcriptional regulator [Dehalococcoidia bacterium]
MHQKELLKGSTETLLLSLVATEPMYGYQIAKEMAKRSSGYFRLKEGTLYPALHRLERGGLVEGWWKETSSGQPRRYYHITSKGLRVLGERLTEWQRFSRAVNSVMPAGAT